MEGDEAFQRPATAGGKNPLTEIGDKLCPEDDKNGICNGHGTCQLGMCFVLLRYGVSNILQSD